MLRRFTSASHGYGLALLVVALASLVKATTQPHIGHLHYTFFYPSIILVTLFAGYRPGLVATALSAFAATFWMPPIGFPLVHDPRDLLGLLVFLANSVLIVAVTHAVHRSRERAEQASVAQARSEQRLSSILSNAPLPVFIKDVRGRYQMVNALFEQAAGVAPGSMMGKTDDDLFPPEVAARFRSDDEAVARSRQPTTVENSFEYRGEHLTFVTTKFPLLDDAGEVQAVCGIAADVTPLKRAEASVRESEERLRLGLRAGSTGTWDWDIRADKVVWSDQLYEFHGLRPGEFDGTVEAFAKLVHPEDAARVAESMRAAMEDGRPYELEFRTVRPGGEVRWLSTTGQVLFEAGRPVRMLGATTDITDRRRAEDELRRSEARLGAVVRSALDCIVGMDHEGRVTEWNPAAERTFGFARAEAAGRELADLIIPPAIRERHREGLARYLATGEGPVLRKRLELTAVRKDGTEFPVELTITPVGTEGRPVFTGFVRDLTEQKRADEARRMSEFRWQRTVEQSPLSTQVFAPDGTVRQVNAAWERLWGITLADIPDYNILHDQQLVERGIMPAIRQAFAGEAATAEPIPYTLDRGQYAGRARWCGANVYPVKDDAGRVEEVVLVHNDVTEQRVAEEANARLAAMVRASRDAILSVGLDGIIQTWNPGAERLFGYRAEEVVGRSISVITVPDAPEQPEQLIGRALGGESIAAVEAVRARKDGSSVDVSVSIDPVRDAAGRIVAMTGVLRDITERKEADRERERLLASEQAARAEAERASRMKDEFLATLSHELRTPLNAILGWSQILAGGSRDDADLAEGLRTIERNARAQTQIIEDLLDMSRIIAGKIRLDVQRLDLAGVVQAAVDTMRPAADAKSIRLQAVIDPRAATVGGDPGRLHQVFWNLISNAIKFTPKGGRVQVLLERVNSHLEVSVIDTGEGIRPEFLPSVFDRFKQGDASTTRRHGGLGLGLSIVKQLVELHGGTVRAASPGEGRGSTFIVALPLTPVHVEPDAQHERRHPRAKAAPPAAPPDDCPKLKGVRVLVVDDEADSRDLVKRLLEDCEANVVLAASAAEALEAVLRLRPDVLVSDIGMPGEDGYSLIRRVRALGAEGGGGVPALALTAYARAEDRVRAVRAGFQTHVVKPVEPAELITMVASLAGRTNAGGTAWREPTSR